MHVIEQRLFCWVGLALSLLLSEGRADTCLRLSGVVQDYATQQPIQARLFIKLTTGRIAVGQSEVSSGQFTVDVDCRAIALVIEQAGYQSQQIALTSLSIQRSAKDIGVIIPLLALDNQATDQVYQQAVQTHYEQQAAETTGQTHRALFTVTDALTNQPLSVKACLFPTNGKPKRCFDTNKSGQFQTSFAQQDIVAVEVQASGYLPYQGNIAVEQLDGRQHRHSIRLLRKLALVTVPIAASWRGVRCSIQMGTGQPTVPLKEVPGVAGQYCTYDLSPGVYQLTVRDAAGVTRHQQAMLVHDGLNVIPISQVSPTSVVIANRSASATELPKSSSATAGSSRVYQLPGELPMVYFNQGSYQLTDIARDQLQQVSSFMQTHPEYQLKLIGHTDPEGDEQMNRYLSEFRSKMIANYLFWQGISESRMSVIGQGSRYPVAASDAEVNKAKNRRVFLKLELANE